jgi:hypothetical protein
MGLSVNPSLSQEESGRETQLHILFELGIKPLAANIYNSSIKGINIPNLDDKVKMPRFAGDTMVILTKQHSFAHQRVQATTENNQ